MIREIYQKLNLKYQIWRTDRKIHGLERMETYLEFDALELALAPFLGIESVYAHIEPIISLRDRKRQLSINRIRLESQLSTLINK